MTFKDWFAQHEWWHENTAEERTRETWNSLMEATNGNTLVVATAMDDMVYVMSNEYGN